MEWLIGLAIVAVIFYFGVFKKKKGNKAEASAPTTPGTGANTPGGGDDRPEMN